MNKQPYEAPKTEIIYFETEDVIVTSNETEILSMTLQN